MIAALLDELPADTQSFARNKPADARTANAILGISDGMVATLAIPGPRFGEQCEFCTSDHFRKGGIFSKVGDDFTRVFLGEGRGEVDVRDDQTDFMFVPYIRMDRKQVAAWDIELCLRYKKSEPLTAASLYRILRSYMPDTSLLLRSVGGNIFRVRAPGPLPYTFLVGAFPHEGKWAIEVLHEESPAVLPLEPMVFWSAQ